MHLFVSYCIASGDPIRVRLLPKAPPPASRARLFHVSAPVSKLTRYHMKKPLDFVEGPCGSYWIRTSDLFHVKEAL